MLETRKLCSGERVTKNSLCLVLFCLLLNSIPGWESLLLPLASSLYLSRFI
jgi:hypothetical protein